MIQKLFLAIGALALPSHAAAQSDCAPEFVLAADGIQIPNIVVGDAQSVVEGRNIQVRNAAANDVDTGSSCSASIRFARFGTSINRAEGPFTIFAGGRALQIVPDESFPSSPATDFPIPSLGTSRNGISVPVEFVIPSGWGIDAGLRVEELVVLLVDDTGGVIDTLPLAITLNYAPSVELRLVGAMGSGGRQAVDLGILDQETRNESDPFGVRVFSSAPYTVTVFSENGGRLLHTDRQSDIAYRLLMDDRIISANRTPVANVSTGTSALGDLYRMLIQVDPFLAKAGDYSDRIEITVTAN
jgi:hypothetical protein